MYVRHSLSPRSISREGYGHAHPTSTCMHCLSHQQNQFILIVKLHVPMCVVIVWRRLLRSSMLVCQSSSASDARMPAAATDRLPLHPFSSPSLQLPRPRPRPHPLLFTTLLPSTPSLPLPLSHYSLLLSLRLFPNTSSHNRPVELVLHELIEGVLNDLCCPLFQMQATYAPARG